MKDAFCQCCKHSYDLGRRHLYTKEHIKKLSQWYERQQKRFDEVYEIAKNLSTLVTTVEHSFWCGFCHMDIKDSGRFIIKNACEHLKSEDHIKNVLLFMKTNGTNHNQYKSETFIIKDTLYKQYMDTCQEINNKDMNYTIYTKTNIGPRKPTYDEIYQQQKQYEKEEIEKYQELLDIENKRLYSNYPYQNIKEIYPLYTELTLNSMPLCCNSFITNSLSLQTFTSKDKIQQNGSGYNEQGERVWGGGIVNIPRKEWILWPIDLIYIHSEQQQKLFIDKKNKEKQVINEEEEEELRSMKQDAFHTNLINNNKYLDIIAPGLSVISLDTNEPLPYGNVYNNKDTLPWLISKNVDEQQKKLENTLNDPIDPRYPKKLRAIDLGIIRTKDRSLSSLHGSYLPNYGSAWQTGSRYDYKQHFTQELRDEKEKQLQINKTISLQSRMQTTEIDNNTSINKKNQNVSNNLLERYRSQVLQKQTNNINSSNSKE